MPRLTRLNVLYFAVVVLVGACTALGATVLAQSQEPRAPVSNAFTFQGRAEMDGVPVDGVCDLRFRLFNAAVAGTQTGPTVDRLAVPVAGGLFSVALDFGAGVFTGEARFLAIELRCPAGSGAYTLLPGRQELTATPYALYAQQVPYTGIIGGPPGFGEGWENVIVVAKSGGQYTSIQAAINSITGASETNRFLVWVAPGIYEERITIPSYVTVRGADRDLVTIEVVGGGSLANSTAVTMSDHSTLESIRVEITGTAVETRAIQAQGASAANSEIKISDVSAWCGATGECIGLYVANTTLEAAEVEIEVSVGSAAQPTGPATGVSISGAEVRLNDFAIEVSRESGGEEAYGVYTINDGAVALNEGTISSQSSDASYGLIHVSTGPVDIGRTRIVSQSEGGAVGIAVLAAAKIAVLESAIEASGGTVTTGVGISSAALAMNKVHIKSESTANDSTGITFSGLAPISLDYVQIGGVTGSPRYGIRATSGSATFARIQYSEIRGYEYGIFANSSAQQFYLFSSILSDSVGVRLGCADSFTTGWAPRDAFCND